jgi:hypothetical protein
LRYVYYLSGIPLLIIGLGILWGQYPSLWKFLAICAAMVGGTLLNRGIKNRPLLPGSLETQRMLVNARDKWAVGIAAMGFYALTFLFMVLGTDKYFSYNQTHPWANLAGVFLLGGIATYFLWHYVRYVIRYRR